MDAEQVVLIVRASSQPNELAYPLAFTDANQAEVYLFAHEPDTRMFTYYGGNRNPYIAGNGTYLLVGVPLTSNAEALVNQETVNAALAKLSTEDRAALNLS